MTEDEAKAKWCPHVRFVIDGQMVFPTGNRFDGQSGNSTTAAIAAKECLCIASACMAWRWLPSFDTSSKLEAIRKYRYDNNSSVEDAKNAVEAEWVEIKTGGYCGLAGSSQ